MYKHTITMTETTSNLKKGTKSAYKQVNQDVSIISQEKYDNIVESMPSFRRLGGSETAMKAYTCKGHIVVRIVSKSPDKQTKVVREFDFTYNKV